MSKEQNLENTDKELHIGGVSESLFTQEQFDYIMEVPQIYLRSHLLYQVRLRDNIESDRDSFEKENNRLLRIIEGLQKQIDYHEREA